MPYAYWYAVVSAPEDPQAGPPPSWGSGLRDRPLRLVCAGELAAVVSDWPQATLKRDSESVDPDLVWRHEHVVENIMASTPVLPVRFGTVLAGDAKIQAVLAERQGMFKADLVHVAGCVELGLRVLWEPPAFDPATVHAVMLGNTAQPVNAATPGAHYLLQRAAEEQAHRSIQQAGKTLAAELNQSLRARAVDVRQSVLQTERLLLSAAYLVPNEDVPAFLAAVKRQRSLHPQLAFLCSGPWPPYHFVSA